jgi:hypothetical protein
MPVFHSLDKLFKPVKRGDQAMNEIAHPAC